MIQSGSSPESPASSQSNQRSTQLPEGRYLVYAFGETVLVVVGILIALQINNWNENRKARLLEYSTLLELQSSLNKDISNCENQIKIQTRMAETSKQLLRHVADQRPYDAALDTMWEKAIRFYSMSFNSSAFELLESRGIDLISNVTLRNEIVNHYNFELSKIAEQLDINDRLSEQNLFYFFDRLYNPITADFEDHFDYKAEILIPYDYESLITDPILIPKLSHTIKTRYRLNQIIGEFIDRQKKLTTAIEGELGI